MYEKLLYFFNYIETSTLNLAIAYIYGIKKLASFAMFAMPIDFRASLPYHYRVGLPHKFGLQECSVLTDMV